MKRLSELTPGSLVSSIEGIDLKGEKALIVETKAKGGGKTSLTLYFPKLKVTKRFVVPSGVKTKSAPEEKRLNPETVDTLRANDPNRSVLPIRDSLPDSFYPTDPNFPSTMTDVLTKPITRRTMFPRYYNYQRRSAAKSELHSELKEITTTIKTNLPHLRKAMLRLNHILRTWEKDGLSQGTWNLIEQEKLYRKVTEGLAQMENLVKRRQEILRRLGKEV